MAQIQDSFDDSNFESEYLHLLHEFCAEKIKRRWYDFRCKPSSIERRQKITPAYMTIVVLSSCLDDLEVESLLKSIPEDTPLPSIPKSSCISRIRDQFQKSRRVTLHSIIRGRSINGNCRTCFILLLLASLLVVLAPL